MANAREAASHVLSWLKPDGDEAAIFTFDTRLDEVDAVHRRAADAARRDVDRSKPFGATSLHDAIAQTAERSAAREAVAARWSCSPTAATTRAG